MMSPECINCLCSSHLSFFPVSDDTIYYEDISASSDSDDHLITNENLNINIEKQRNVEQERIPSLANFNEQSQTIASLNQSNLFTVELLNAHQRFNNESYQSIQTCYQGPPATETSAISTISAAKQMAVDNAKPVTKHQVNHYHDRYITSFSKYSVNIQNINYNNICIFN